MAKKTRLKEDAFSWVQDTTQAADKPKTPAKPKPVMAEKPARTAAPPGQERTIVVKYNRSSGQIADILEKKGGEDFELTWSDIAANQTISQILLTDALEHAEVIDIHRGFRVDTASRPPRVVPLR